MDDYCFGFIIHNILVKTVSSHTTHRINSAHDGGQCGFCANTPGDLARAAPAPGNRPHLHRRLHSRQKSALKRVKNQCYAA